MPAGDRLLIFPYLHGVIRINRCDLTAWMLNCLIRETAKCFSVGFRQNNRFRVFKKYGVQHGIGDIKHFLLLRIFSRVLAISWSMRSILFLDIVNPSSYNRFTVKGTAASRVFYRLVAQAVRMREQAA